VTRVTFSLESAFNPDSGKVRSAYLGTGPVPRGNGRMGRIRGMLSGLNAR